MLCSGLNCKQDIVLIIVLKKKLNEKIWVDDMILYILLFRFYNTTLHLGEHNDLSWITKILQHSVLYLCVTKNTPISAYTGLHNGMFLSHQKNYVTSTFFFTQHLHKKICTAAVHK